MGNGNIQELPEGFVLDRGSMPKLPEGFVLDTVEKFKPSPIEESEQAPQQIQSPIETQSKILGINKPETGSTSNLIGAGEVGLSLLTSAIAEPLAGLGGVAGAIGTDAERGTEVIEQAREAFTFQPRTEKGQEFLQKTGEFLQPIADFFKKIEKELGDNVFKETNSPALAAAAATIPTAIVEVLGVTAGTLPLRATKAAKKALKQGKISKSISESAPSVEQLKDTARAVYKEIDDTGAIINKNAFSSLSNKLVSEAKRSGLDKDITPNAVSALKRFQELDGKNVSITELDILRKVAQGAADSLNRTEKAIGIQMIDTIDTFLDNANEKIFLDPSGRVPDFGPKYKAARDLWGRARRSELLDDAFTKARIQATGFENGLRIHFRSILNNKKQRRFFSQDEIKAIEKVVMGDTKENIAKLIGRLGFGEGQATNIVGAAIGSGAGAAIFGPGGAVVFPLVGQISRKLAQRMTAKNAQFADDVIRAGKDARKITAAYLKNTPENLRSAEELSQLLLREDINLKNLQPIEIAEDARRLTMQNRSALAGALAPQVIKNNEQPIR